MRINRRQTAILVALLLVAVLLAGIVRASAPARADDPISAIVNAVTGEALEGYVRDLSGERAVLLDGQPATITTRFSGSAGVQLSEDYLRQHFESLGLPTTLWPYGTNGWRDVVATQAGVLHPEQIYIICAHHDDRASDSGNEPAPGADDNGSGTAAVMLAATLLSQYQFEYTIQYVTFSGEEQGLFGSRAYAHQARLLGEQILGVINLDMIAFNRTGGALYQLHARDAASQALANAYYDIVDRYHLPLAISLYYGNRAMGSSDHVPFWDNGFPAVLGIEDYPLDFNTCYHQTCDRAGLFDMEYYVAATKGALGALATLARPAAGQPTPTPTSAPLPTPTAPCLSNLPDGDFEAGPQPAAWQSDTSGGYPLISNTLSHAGEWAAWLTQQNNATDRLCQTLAAPARAATLSFWWQMQTDERWHNTDWLELRARPVGSAGYTTLARLDDGAAQHLWQETQVSLAAFAGQQIELCFVASSDYGDRTWFFVDDVRLAGCEPAVSAWFPLWYKR